MNKIITLCLIWLSTIGWAQGADELSAKVQQLDKSYTVGALKPLVSEFERLWNHTPNNWLLPYYAAYVNVRIADLLEGSAIDTYCDQAEKYLKAAEKLQDADKSEIYALYAYLYSAKVKVSPMFRGSKYGKIGKEYIEKAIGANPSNPRAYVIRAIGTYFKPKMFGGGKDKAQPIIDKALEKFEQFVPKSANHPHWGKGMLLSINH